MLDSIPQEILQHIAYHLSLPTLHPPIQLLLTSKSINEALSFNSNTNLYARTFKSNFDTSALARRFNDGDAKVGSSPHLASELKLRVGALRRFRKAIEICDVEIVQEKDLWVVFVMLLEHDHLNLTHLLSRDSPSGFHLPTFLKLFHEQNLLAAAIEPGYPADTGARALTMWIAWLLRCMKVDPSIEPPEDRDERLFVLRPYVFAAQQYEVYYAPWTIPDLPISLPEYRAAQPRPFVADLTLKSRKTEIEHYGRKISIATPMLSHAAILSFFNSSIGEDEDLDDEDLDMDEEVASPFDALTRDETGDPAQVDLVNDLMANSHLVHQASVNGSTSPSMTASVSASNNSNYESLNGAASQLNDFLSNPTPSFQQSMTTSSRVNPSSKSLSSKTHDRDWARLRNCYDPSTCAGLDAKTWKGAFSGCWEGNFSFFEFEAFREMLAGQSRALYEGPFGQQAQVWKLHETFVRPKRLAGSANHSDEDIKIDVKGKGKAKSEGDVIAEDDNEDLEVEEFPAQNIKQEVSDILKKGKADAARSKGLPLKGPATNAGFPTDQPSSTSAGLATATAEAATLRETIRQQVEAIVGYEIVPDEELDRELQSDDCQVEVLLTGTGHSAWGRFILKGRVRIWDGMATLVKEYAPDSRGKWVYRGYIVQGDIFVGRWRDTFTPEAYIGYEGTFILNRRS